MKRLIVLICVALIVCILSLQKRASAHRQNTSTRLRAAAPPLSLLQQTCSLIIVSQSVVNGTYTYTPDVYSPNVLQGATTDSELPSLIQTLTEYYYLVYNLMFNADADINNPFVDGTNQCLALFLEQPNEIVYEHLINDIQQYAALSNTPQYTQDQRQSVVMVYFMCLVRQIQVEFSSIDLSNAVVYNPSNNTLTTNFEFLQVSAWPKPLVQLLTGTPTPQQVADQIFVNGMLRYNKSYSFICPLV